MEWYRNSFEGFKTSLAEYGLRSQRGKKKWFVYQEKDGLYVPVSGAFSQKGALSVLRRTLNSKDLQDYIASQEEPVIFLVGNPTKGSSTPTFSTFHYFAVEKGPSNGFLDLLITKIPKTQGVTPKTFSLKSLNDKARKNWKNLQNLQAKTSSSASSDDGSLPSSSSFSSSVSSNYSSNSSNSDSSV